MEKSYDIFVIDVYNLFYRCSKKDNIYEILNEMIKFIEIDLHQVAKPDSLFYFLFDPLPKNNLSIKKAVRRLPYEVVTSNIRKLISKAYKEARKYKPETFRALLLFQKYLQYRNPYYLIVEDGNVEADDYVEYVVNSHAGKNILLVSTDLDWARFISDTVEMSGTLHNYFTPETFEKKYGFIPTVASITLSKALTGDSSDMIVGALYSYKKKRPPHSLIKSAREWVIQVGKEGIDLKKLSDRINHYSLIQLIKEKASSPEKEVIYYFIVSEDNLVQSLNNNIRLIKSRCKSVAPYIKRYLTVDNAYCKTIDKLIQKTNKSTFKFGI